MKLRYILFLVVLFLLMGAIHVEARVVTEAVAYRHGSVILEGHLAYDDAVAGKRPGVLVVHEWWGLNDYARKRSEQLAALGYIAFALDMYGKGKATTHPKDAREWSTQVSGNVQHWRQRALAGLEVLRRHPRVDPGHIAAIGYCFGGSTVQQLAYSGADIRGVVSFHGSLLPFAPGEAQGVRAKILICHGAADPLVTQEAMNSYVAAMEASRLDWQMIVYGGAKHGFTNPDADKAGMAAVGYSKRADQRSWSHMQLFFREVFSE